MSEPQNQSTNFAALFQQLQADVGAQETGSTGQQVMHMDAAYCLIMKDDTGAACGFVMGYFKQYDDIVGYTLEEILIAAEHQGKGLGSLLLKELESRVKEKGASCVELQAVKDDLHERYYSKAGFKDAKNFVLKVKWFA